MGLAERLVRLSNAANDAVLRKAGVDPDAKRVFEDQLDQCLHRMYHQGATREAATAEAVERQAAFIRSSARGDARGLRSGFVDRQVTALCAPHVTRAYTGKLCTDECARPEATR